LQAIAPKLGISTTRSMLESILSKYSSAQPLEVLELGCGRDSVVLDSSTKLHYTGLEIFEDYAIEIEQKIISSNNVNVVGYKILRQDFLNYDFKEKQFDIVILIDVLEHLYKADGHKVLELIHRLSKKAIVIKTPNGFVHQNAFDGNEHQAHLSGWEVDEFRKKNFKVYGMSGLKSFRKPVHCDQWEDDLSLTIKFRPKKFWLLVAGLSQIIAKRIPRLSYELLAVKYIDS
jgi:2-polyprenyl-3-methyl-5-hydroxy-6-metoxy-1,4-benzoquinol methylase